ncbi:MAG TPA: YncE family protein, partial [Gemmatimonadales bacterium]|nr:YncE family protein [Gemmatimonadales bacterium]
VGVQSGTVLEVKVATDSVLRTFSIGGHPQGIAVSSDGAELYVADEASDSLHILNLASGAQVGAVLLAGGAYDLQLSPDGTKLWVGEPAGVIQVVNRVTRTVARTYVVGGTVRRMAFTPDGTTVVAANEGGWVDFIRDH